MMGRWQTSTVGGRGRACSDAPARRSMGSSKPTDGGNAQEAFHTTSWHDVLAVRTADEARRQAAVEKLLERYWRPVHAYIRRYVRRKGGDPDGEAASDLAQGFFTDVVLSRHLLQDADPGKGRFRALLQKAVRNYLTDEHRKQEARKRSPEGRVVSLESVEDVIPGRDPHGTPEEAFVFAWASQLLDEVLASVEAGCRRSGQDKHWEVFRRTVLEPVLTGADAPPLSRLCRELSIENEQRASNMNMTVKRRFRAAVETHVREFVDSDDEVEQEIRELMAILSGSGTRH